VNIFQKFIAVESAFVISIFLYTSQYIHAFTHLLITIYLINHLKKVKTDFVDKEK
jgi:hypothetical protein